MQHNLCLLVTLLCLYASLTYSNIKDEFRPSHLCLRQMSCVVLLVLAYLIGACGVDCCPCNTSDVWSALAALYHSTNGRGWLRSDGWLLEGTNVCDWHGVTCSSLILDSNNLTGSLPRELSTITSLTYLNFGHNALTGSLPPELSALENITHFNITNNRLRGPLPSAYGALKKTLVFDASLNQLSGTLPAAYGNWSDVLQFEVVSNDLEGPLQAAYGDWTDLLIFKVNNNRGITGSIPDAFSFWGSVTTFVASNCSLSGSLPQGLRDWVYLVVFRIDNNAVSGALNPEWNWSSMEIFGFANNRLTGTLPPTFSRWTQLIQFNVENNSLQGTLPPEYSSWENVNNVVLRYNALTGTLPSEYHSWRDLRNFIVNNNRLEGTLSPQYSSWTNIRTVAVSSNNFNSTIPSSYASWTKSIVLFFLDNRLSGTLQAFFASLPQLRVLGLNNNNFSGTIPAAWVSFQSLAILALYGNAELTGSIPANMPFVLAVSVCNTSLCGALPKTWTLPAPLGPAVRCAPFTSAEVDALIAGTYILVPVAADPVAPTPQCPTTLPRVLTPRPAVAPARAQARSALPPVTVAIAIVANSVVAAVVDVRGLRIGAALLHVSSMAVRMSRRPCGDTTSAARDGTDDTVGAAVADNPTRVTLPGSLGFAGGAVVGNGLIFTTLPLLATTFHWLKALWHRSHATWDWKRHAVSPLYCALSGLGVPTIAASIVLFLGDDEADVRAAGVCLGTCGAAMCLVPAAVVASALIRTRESLRRVRLSSARTPRRRHPNRGPSVPLPLRLAAVLRQEICHWDTRRVDSGWADAWLRPLLPGARKRWVLAWDNVCLVVQGALVGVGSSRRLPCDAVVAACWALCGVCAVMLAVAAALRPRQTALEGLLDVLMNTWTLVIVLMACLKADQDVADAVTTAQAIAQLCCSLPLAIRWGATKCRLLTAKGPPLTPHTKAGRANALRTRNTQRPAWVPFLLSQEAMGLDVHQRLQAVIRLACCSSLPCS